MGEGAGKSGGGVLTVMGMWCAAATKAEPGDLRRPERVVLGLRAGIWCPAVDLRDRVWSPSGVTVRRGETLGALTPAGTSERSAELTEYGVSWLDPFRYVTRSA